MLRVVRKQTELRRLADLFSSSVFVRCDVLDRGAAGKDSQPGPLVELSWEKRSVRMGEGWVRKRDRHRAV